MKQREEVCAVDINRMAKYLDQEGLHTDFISSMWDDQFPVEEKRHFFRRLLTEFPELREESQYYLNPEGMDKLAESKFEDLPLSMWTYIKLGWFDGKFSCDTLHKKIDNILR